MARRVTNLLMVLAFVLTITWPLELRHKPTMHDTLAVKKAFASRLLYHTVAVMVCLVGAGVGATIYVRQARHEYREAALKNLRTLVEGEEAEPS